MRVIAIDPGYDRLGVALLEGAVGSEVLLFSECVLSDKADALDKRLFSVVVRVHELIKKWHPDSLAMEELFFNTNQKTALGVARVTGALMYVAHTEGIPCVSYTPLQIKQALTGYGRAEKAQVRAMVHQLVKIEKRIVYDDEYDAIAVGLCALASLAGVHSGA